ncbi:MAG TPA: M13-type metalloendopeptidase, partial [Longimicrobiales bacterium]
MKHNLRLQAALLFLAMAAAPAAAQVKSSGSALGIDVAGMDRAARPQDDFFRFVNGAWADKTTIPADLTSYGSFIVLREKSQDAIKAIIDEASAQKNAPGSTQQKVGDMYRSFMDTARIESLGLKPLQGELSYIAKLKATADLPAALAHIARVGVVAPFGAGVSQDPKNSNQYIVSMGQSGLHLPDRDYYLRSDDKFVAIRKAYADFITQVFTLAKQPDPQGAAQRIITLETQIAQKQWDRARLRDRNATYNKMTVAELAQKSPGFAWRQWLDDLGGASASDVVVRQPDYMSAAADIVNSTPIGTWKEYLTLGLLTSYADELPSAFNQAGFNFFGKELSGQEEMRPRWKRGVSAVERVVGEPVGKLYVEKYFSPAAKARMDELVKNLLAAYKVGINELEWMSPATKAQAQEKLSKFTVKIGYPDRWRDYAALQINSADLIGNMLRARAFQNAESWSHLGKPVERWRWGMTPQTVNAYYNSGMNEIVFPAAILQPPFFNVEADDAVNYGAIGAVIGHEIGHGFDDQGSQYDGTGQLNNWWTDDDRAAFEKLTAALIEQYNGLSPEGA